MSNFIPTQDISTKLSLLNTYHDTILKEYRDNISELEFRDFTNEQNYYISKFKQGYPTVSYTHLTLPTTPYV